MLVGSQATVYVCERLARNLRSVFLSKSVFSEAISLDVYQGAKPNAHCTLLAFNLLPFPYVGNVKELCISVVYQTLYWCLLWCRSYEKNPNLLILDVPLTGEKIHSHSVRIILRGTYTNSYMITLFSFDKDSLSKGYATLPSTAVQQTFTKVTKCHTVHELSPASPRHQKISHGSVSGIWSRKENIYKYTYASCSVYIQNCSSSFESKSEEYENWDLFSNGKI